MGTSQDFHGVAIHVCMKSRVVENVNMAGTDSRTIYITSIADGWFAFSIVVFPRVGLKLFTCFSPSVAR